MPPAYVIELLRRIMVPYPYHKAGADPRPATNAHQIKFAQNSVENMPFVRYHKPIKTIYVCT